MADSQAPAAAPESPPTGGRGGAPLVRIADVRKAFGATRALVACSLDIAGGEIRALLGENGSGKSTLVKILSGVLPADGGEIVVDGVAAAFRSPRQAQAAGVVTVFQETLIVPELSVVDNIFLGTDGLFGWHLSRTEQRRLAAETLAALDAASIGLDTRLEALPLHRRQIITLARALVRPWRLLILDEATSALDIGGRDALFRYLKHHRPAGSAVLFITHRMDEIANLADSVTLLQSGETTATLPIADAPAELLITMISKSRGEGGAGLVRRADGAAASARATETARFRARDIVLRPGARPIDLEVKPGEILGFSGLDGHGQADFLAVLARLRKPESGSVEDWHDGAWRPVDTMREAVRRGICYVPRDRKNEGLFAGLSVLDNYGLPTLSRWSRLTFIDRKGLSRRAVNDLNVMRTRYPGLKAPVGRLSGGNQQKVLLARWLAVDPKLMILDDPLRGVDAATKVEVYQVFRDLAARGVTLLFLSTEIEELLISCDRVIVFREAQVSRILEGSTLSREAVVAAMFGQTDDGGRAPEARP